MMNSFSFSDLGCAVCWALLLHTWDAPSWLVLCPHRGCAIMAWSVPSQVLDAPFQTALVSCAAGLAAADWAAEHCRQITRDRRCAMRQVAQFGSLHSAADHRGAGAAQCVGLHIALGFDLTDSGCTIVALAVPLQT